MDKKPIIVIICAVLPLCLVIFIASRQNIELSQSNSQQVLINSVDEQVEGILLQLSQAQSAEQGFVLTGKDQLLTPSIVASAEIERHLRRLNRLVADNNQQSERVKRLEPLVKERMNLISTIVIARKQGGFDTAVRVLSQGKAEELSKDIKGIAEEILAGEQELIKGAASNRQTTENLKKERLLLLAAFLGLFMIASNIVFERLTN